jgi:hypothetical protein
MPRFELAECFVTLLRLWIDVNRRDPRFRGKQPVQAQLLSGWL